MTRLFVGRLSYGTTQQSLQRHFAAVGEVVEAKVITDRDSGQSKGFGFVEMRSEEAARHALATLNGSALDGRDITVAEARPQQRR
ncbi:MAG: RNA-binding protein [Chloroflexi bacterium]|nr:RNA-binding protein [Chloroflexota bacterium]